MHWDYPHFLPVEYVAAGATTLAGFALQYGGPEQFPDSGWSSGILFDDAVRDFAVARTNARREKWAKISDYLWNGTQYFPVIDSLFVPLVTDKFNTEVALQLTLLNWQAQGIAFVLVRMSHRVAGRARPSLQECDRDPEYDGACDPESPGRTASFMGGHAAMAFAGAGLTCAHHQALELYGHPAADAGICGLTLATASVTAYLRIVADRHWASDIVVGVATGAALGYGLPWLLHYRYGGAPKALGAGLLPERTAVIPMVASDSLGAAWVGMF